jgi:hypothetical protein
VFQWRALDFEYPSEEIRQYAKFTKDFVPENNLPVGIEVWRNKLFVTVPRWEDGEFVYLFVFIYFLFHRLFYFVVMKQLLHIQAVSS